MPLLYYPFNHHTHTNTRKIINKHLTVCAGAKAAAEAIAVANTTDFMVDAISC